jgi:hypothetical protein
MREYGRFKVLKIGGETGQGSGFHAAFHALFKPAQHRRANYPDFVVIFCFYWVYFTIIFL